MNDKKRKAIENLNKRILGEGFDADRYQETEDEARGELLTYLKQLSKMIPALGDEIDNIMNLADSYADDMWREGAQGGFADR